MIEVLSLFDGIGVGKLALNALGIESNYLGAEIDSYAVSISERNGVIPLGDVYDVEVKGMSWNLLLGGSPCQSFSSLGNRSGFDGKSGVFWEYVRVLNEGSFDYFLFENVKMKGEWLKIISDALGVEPILINSADFSAQSRSRYYWTNIPIMPWESGGGPTLSSILEENDNYLKESTIARLRASRTGGRLITADKPKAATIIAGYGKMPSDQEYLITSNGVRPFTPIEFERLQGLPDNYTAGLSKTQRYRCVGNSWNLPTIIHILRGLPYAQKM